MSRSILRVMVAGALSVALGASAAAADSVAKKTSSAAATPASTSASAPKPSKAVELVVAAATAQSCTKLGQPCSDCNSKKRVCPPISP